MILRGKKDSKKELVEAFEAVELIRNASDVESTYLLVGYAFGVVCEKMDAKRLSKKTGKVVMKVAEAVGVRQRMIIQEIKDKGRGFSGEEGEGKSEPSGSFYYDDREEDDGK